MAKFWARSVLAILMVAIMGAVGSWAADKPAAEKQPTQGKLPSYYSKVITAQQREKIYAIQAKHQAEIDRLTAELQATIAKQETEVEAVLTPEQRSQVEKWRNAAAERRKEQLAKEKPDEVIKKAVEKK